MYRLLSSLENENNYHNRKYLYFKAFGGVESRPRNVQGFFNTKIMEKENQSYCKKCDTYKDVSKFHKNISIKDNCCTYCKSCSLIKSRGLTEVLHKIYSAQITNNKKRGHGQIGYSRTEFINRFKNNKDYHELHNKWKKSGYNSDIKPSFDRINIFLGYSFDNIKLTTWKKNKQNHYNDVKRGIDDRTSKAVTMINKNTREECDFHSIIEASRQTNINVSTISQACLKNRNSAGGYYWRFKTDKCRNFKERVFKTKPVVMISKINNEETTFPSIIEASEKMKIHSSNISACLSSSIKSAGGYYWRLETDKDRKFKKTSSNYKGVSWNKLNNKWYAQIQFKGKRTHLGTFKSELEAAEAYQKALTDYNNKN